MKIIFKDYKLLSTNEHKRLLEIRNLEHIRENSLEKSIIGLESHLKWLFNLKDSLYFAVFMDDEIYGGFSLNALKSNSSWGVFFRQDTNVLLLSICVYKFLEFAFFKVQTLNSIVKISNKNSLTFTKNFGFKEVEKTPSEVKFSQNIQEWQEFRTKKFIKKVDDMAKSYEIKFKVKND